MAKAIARRDGEGQGEALLSHLTAFRRRLVNPLEALLLPLVGLVSGAVCGVLVVLRLDTQIRKRS